MKLPIFTVTINNILHHEHPQEISQKESTQNICKTAVLEKYFIGEVKLRSK